MILLPLGNIGELVEEIRESEEYIAKLEGIYGANFCIKISKFPLRSIMNTSMEIKATIKNLQLQGKIHYTQQHLIASIENIINICKKLLPDNSYDNL